MTRLLHVSASPRGEQSESIALAGSFLSTYREAHPDAVIDEWNLWETDLPDMGPAAAQAKMNALTGTPLTDAQNTSWNRVLDTFRRFDSYEHYLFSVPMWNHGLPYVLKHFIDVISQNGLLFAIDQQTGYRGLLAGKKAAVVYTAAVYHPGSPDEFGVDFHAMYFDYWLRFAGITDVARITFHANMFDDNAGAFREQSHRAAAILGKGF
ncbi:NAD(P)H-dependent oxidoreductase [Nocardia sp. NPDC004604]|uniref:FMN-dependent NADH-azoreductase n=1 Tax=Nocardia sp. NPDC004604 TaxID=3157013 RepID=UPI0033A435FA